MQFLHPFTGSSSNLTTPPLTDASETEDLGPTDPPRFTTGPMTQSEEQTQEDEINIQDFCCTYQPFEYIPMKKRPKTAAEIVAAPIIDLLKAATEKQKLDDNKQENPMLTFFTSLIPDTDLLTSENKRKFKLEVMTKLNNLIEQQQTCRNESYPPSYTSPISPSESLASTSAGTS